MGQEELRGALTGYHDDVESIVDLAVQIQQIPSPTFSEQARADFVQSQLHLLGLQDVSQDGLHNVYARYAGRSGGDPLIISAHTDTVFDSDTNLKVTRDGERVCGPGIADNSLGVAGLLTIARTFQALNVAPARDVWFVANVGEEGLGDLRGMRAVVERFEQRGWYVVLEGGLFGYVCHEAIGVRRFRVEVKGPGGHSWGSFGTPSATHVLGNLISRISHLDPPTDPKTTFNVGVIEGGTTVNTIARRASMLLDLRSEDPAALEHIVKEVEKLAAAVVQSDEMGIEIHQIGYRPAGRIDRGTQLVRMAAAAFKEMGQTEPEYTMASTDANIPLSHGLPAVCVGLSRSGHTHRPDEYMEVGSIPNGLGQALLLTLAASGVA
jgi:acetylornithine deacetylase/succinyl-diaminopimelate desuccinylase-like protein